MTLIGLDLTASRVRAVAGAATLEPSSLALDGASPELPLAVSLEERTAVAGAAGTALARCKPHLACLDFLPLLGAAREWVSPRHRLDAARALTVVFEQLAKPLGKTRGLAAALPAYLSDEQAALIEQAALKAKWPWLGSISAPVAAAQAAREQLPWTGVALVVDVDGYALTWSGVAVSETALQLLECEPCPQLSLNVWLNRLIDGIAHHCIRRTRRDPRESGDAEQSLYNQLAAALDAEAHGRMIELNVQTHQWYQSLMLQPGELAALCSGQVRQSIAAMKAFAASVSHHGPIAAMIATSAAARLPGLLPALDAQLQDLPSPTSNQAEPDFGESLLLHEGFAAAHVLVLPADAVAKTAHQLAAMLVRGEATRGHADSFSLHPAAPPPEVGPARLLFRGQEYVLTDAVFLLGRDAACNLVFDSDLYPTVSARHCEIVFDRRVYVLRDRSRHGTLVNEERVRDQTVLHSGDWIRLAPGGPLIHFLGQPSDQRRLMTMA